MIPDDFNLVNVTDTCALWNVVGADTLFRSARRVNMSFIMTPTVYFECFVKSRGRPVTAERQSLRRRLRDHLHEDQVTEISVSIDALQEALAAAKRNGSDKRLGAGELSCAALARSLGHPSVLTDNRRDFTAIEAIVDGRLQTTPRLLGWLFVEGHLSDSDVLNAVREHEESQGDMAKTYRRAYDEACEKKLMRHMSWLDEATNK